jgi:hypothetical protein
MRTEKATPEFLGVAFLLAGHQAKEACLCFLPLSLPLFFI